MFRLPLPGFTLSSQFLREAFFLSAVVGFGVAFFFYRFGLLVLDPASTEWLFGTSDAATHYIGWLYFRQEPWSFPLGRIVNYLAPLGTSIALVDGLPLLAIPLKTMTHLLPDAFQYFGFWLLINYALQGLFGYLILRTLTDSRPLLLVGTLFFFFCPSFLHRHSHIPLSSHWLLLAALYLYFKPISSWGVRAKLIAWFVLVGTACLVHTYLTMMVLGIGVADLSWEFFTARRLRKRGYIVALTGMAGLIALSWFLAGHLLYGGDTDLKALGYGHYSMNINSLVNPMGHGRILPDLPLGGGQYEGYNYLGFGMLLLAVAVIYALVTRPDLRKKIGSHKALFIVLVCFWLYALSNRLVVGDIVLFSNREFFFFKPVASAFRASGRFFWPLLYCGIAVGFAVLVRTFPFRLVFLLLLAGLGIQVFDLTSMLNLRAYYAGRKLEPLLVSPYWQEASHNLAGILSYPPFEPATRDDGDFKHFALLTLPETKPVSAGYAARLAYRRSMAIQEELRADFLSGDLDPSYLYVVRDHDFLTLFPHVHGRLHTGNWDGYKVFFAPEARITAPDYYAGSTRVRLNDYLRQGEDKLLLVSAVHDAAGGACEEYRRIFREFGAPIENSVHCGALIAIVCRGDVVFNDFSLDEAVEVIFTEGHACGDLRFDHEVSLLANNYPADNWDHIRVSIQVDGQEAAFNAEGINIVALDREQDLLEVAHFGMREGDEGILIEVTRP